LPPPILQAFISRQLIDARHNLAMARSTSISPPPQPDRLLYCLYHVTSTQHFISPQIFGARIYRWADDYFALRLLYRD
jgi:hypothetical protein